VSKLAINNKYLLIIIQCLFLVVIFSVVGSFELIVAILACDLTLVLTTPIFVKEIKEIMKKKDNKVILKQESPIDWIKSCVKFALISLLIVLAYALVKDQIILNQPQNVDFLFYFGIIFFLVAILHTIRYIWFIIDPLSTSNIFAGKVLLTISKYGPTAIILAFIGLLLSFNGLNILQIYLPFFEQNLPLTLFGWIFLFTLILSFVAVIPTIYVIVFHLNEKVSVWYLLAGIAFISPLILLVISSLLLT